MRTKSTSDNSRPPLLPLPVHPSWLSQRGGFRGVGGGTSERFKTRFKNRPQANWPNPHPLTNFEKGKDALSRKTMVWMRAGQVRFNTKQSLTTRDVCVPLRNRGIKTKGKGKKKLRAKGLYGCTRGRQTAASRLPPKKLRDGTEGRRGRREDRSERSRRRDSAGTR